MDEMYDTEPGKRWDPIGAPKDNEVEIPNFKSSKHEHCDQYQCVHAAERLKSLEEQQELLSSSLFALTTHCAQVQFRLKQIVDSAEEDRENLLKSLEEFAFRGIPDVSEIGKQIDEARLAETLRLRRAEQQQFIEKLKIQLNELEHYIIESNKTEVSRNTQPETQHKKWEVPLNLNMDEQKFHQTSQVNVKQWSDVALDQVASPYLMKENLIPQLETEDVNLQQLTDYLQIDKSSTCCALYSINHPYKTDTVGMVQHIVMLVQMFATMHFGCSGQAFKMNHLKSTLKVDHWGNLRARLEIAIAKIVELVEFRDHDQGVQVNYTHDSIAWNVKITVAVRQDLAISIRDLIQHGAVAEKQNYNFVTIMGCFPWRINNSHSPTHAWKIIQQYYHYKNGEIFNSRPDRKLSDSFNLDIDETSQMSTKHTLLSTIGNIIATHSVYKQSDDSQFKAFICAALNCNKLVKWLSLIFQCHDVLNKHYRPWSYSVKTGFTDALQSLDVLSCRKFYLPVDIEIGRFQNIKDAFT